MRYSKFHSLNFITVKLREKVEGCILRSIGILISVKSLTLIKRIKMADLSYISPCFIVEDIGPSAAFYRDKLGFKVLYLAPDEGPFFAIVGRDNISIMLKAVAAAIKPIPNRTRHEWAPWDAYISVTDPNKLFEEYIANGVSFHSPLQVNGDKLLGFEVKDADGYLLFFGRPE
jgi:hypothetical protein